MSVVKDTNVFKGIAKIAASVALICITASFLSVSGGAHTAYADELLGTCGSNLSAYVSDDHSTLAIKLTDASGSTESAMSDYASASEQPWNAYAATIKQVNVCYGATTIGVNAFNGLSKMETVYVPETLKTIKKNAFDGCTLLKSVYIGYSYGDFDSEVTIAKTGNDPFNNAYSANRESLDEAGLEIDLYEGTCTIPDWAIDPFKQTITELAKQEYVGNSGDKYDLDKDGSFDFSYSGATIKKLDTCNIETYHQVVTPPSVRGAIYDAQNSFLARMTFYATYDEEEDDDPSEFSNHDLDYATVTVPSKVYTGAPIKPKDLAVEIGGIGLARGTDYKITGYENNVNVGFATVAIEGNGDYYNTAFGAYKIVPQGTAITALQAGKKYFKVTWKKQATQTTGYIIQYSQKKSFKSASTVKVKRNSVTSKKVSKLKSGSTYYVRVRTFKNVDGELFRSSWSKAKSVVVK